MQAIFRDKLIQAHNDNYLAQERLDKASSSYQALQQALTKQKEEVSVVEAQLAELEGRLDGVSLLVGEKKQLLSRQDLRKDELRRSIARLRRENAALEKRVQGLQSTVAEKSQFLEETLKMLEDL